MKQFLLISALLVGTPQIPLASDAKQCISVGFHESEYGPSNNSQTLTNTCSGKVEVVWCHNNDAKRYKDSRCGRNGKYYQKHDVLEPGEVKKNQYTLPSEGKIYFGACSGGYYSTETKQWNDGTYRCK